MKTIRRTISPEVKVLDEKKGITEYIASDETLDKDREIVRADGWRFDLFQKNAPFVDSHDYSSVEKLLGKVIDFEVKGKKLVETVQWAMDVPEHRLAKLGWDLTRGGFLKAVSVGFRPIKGVSRTGNPSVFKAQLDEMGVKMSAPVDLIYTEQQQLELSAVVVGANPNALAKAYKDALITDDDFKFLADLKAAREQIVKKQAEAEDADSIDNPAQIEKARARAAERFLNEYQRLVKRI